MWYAAQMKIYVESMGSISSFVDIFINGGKGTVYSERVKE